MQVRPKYRLDSKDKPTAATPQESAAKLPDAIEAKPVEPPVESDPVKEAQQSALKARLAEMESAEKLQRAAPTMQERMATEPQQPQQQPLTVEQIIENSGLPDRAKVWLRQHPEYVTDFNKSQEIRALHNVAARQAGSEFTDHYFQRMEDLLGLAPTPSQQPPRPAPQRQSTPVRQYVGPPVSAPPTRETPSMTTGRPMSGPVKLTREEHDLAHSLGITEQEYLLQKQRMERL